MHPFEGKKGRERERDTSVGFLSVSDTKNCHAFMCADVTSVGTYEHTSTQEAFAHARTHSLTHRSMHVHVHHILGDFARESAGF